MRVFVPDFWNSLSYEKKISVYNGTGPDYFTEWTRSALDLVFWWASEPVMVHDVEYAFGTSKFMADIRLLINCLLKSKLKIRRIFLSFAAFFGVLFGGKNAWNAKFKIKKL